MGYHIDAAFLFKKSDLSKFIDTMREFDDKIASLPYNEDGRLSTVNDVFQKAYMHEINYHENEYILLKWDFIIYKVTDGEAWLFFHHFKEYSDIPYDFVYKGEDLDDYNEEYLLGADIISIQFDRYIEYAIDC